MDCLQVFCLFEFIYLVNFFSFGLVWRHIEFLTILQKIQLCHHRNTFKNILKPIYWTDELLVAEIWTYCVWLRRGVRLRNKFFFQFYRQSGVQDWRNSWPFALFAPVCNPSLPSNYTSTPRPFGWFYYVFFSFRCLICVFILTFSPVAWYLLLPTPR